MAEGGIPIRDLYCHPQFNSMAETGRTDPVHVGERVYFYETRVDHVGTDTKGKRRYLGYRAAVGLMEGNGGGDI